MRDRGKGKDAQSRKETYQAKAQTLHLAAPDRNSLHFTSLPSYDALCTLERAESSRERTVRIERTKSLRDVPCALIPLHDSFSA